jgi:hypothetical protein
LLFAGTERGAFMSLDDGDNWEPLQLNLPVTSVRDFEIYGNDLIVATHGRGFWVIDDISSLRQVTPTILAGDAYLFKPGDSINVQQGGDNGTPLQKDEPQATNPPNGAFIDYYLKSAATGPVTLDILDASGAVLYTFSAETGAEGPVAGRGFGGGAGRGRGGGIPNVSALWRPTPEPFSTGAGMHRVVWNPIAIPPNGAGRPFGRGTAPTPLTGTFTARLSVGGKTYTQSFVVKPDPRLREA